MRKTHIFRNREQPAMVQLKQLPQEARARIFGWAKEKNQDDARARILSEYGIKVGSNSVLSRFCSWQFNQQRLENYNQLVGQFEEWYARVNPTASRDKIREAGIA